MKTIFVSSTFRDMDRERDAIQQIVSPMLNKEARRHGQSVSFCDLRWGIDTSLLESESGSQKVLEVCLDEIDRCQPPMVVILGDRYGWIPSESLVRSTADKYALELDDLEKSVTALEIEYGALSSTSKFANTLFYFRQIDGLADAEYRVEDEAHARRLRELKERIWRLCGERVRTYTLHWRQGALEGVENFAHMLCEDLMQILLPQWQRYDAMSALEREVHIHDSFLLEKAGAFRARKDLADQVQADINSGKKLTILRGSVGSGKSTLLSHICSKLREQGWEVLALYSNLTHQTATAMEILQLMVRYLEDALGLDPFSRESQQERNLESEDMEQIKQILQVEETFSVKHWQQRLDELCVLYAKGGRKILFALDAADQLFQDDYRENLVFIPNDLGPNVRFLMTCLPGVNLKGNPAIEIPPVTQSDKRQVIMGILHSHGKELSEPVITAMENLPGADNPLYLSFLVQRMLMMNKADFDIIRSSGDGMDAITAYQLQVLRNCAADLDNMGAELMDAAAQRVGGQMVTNALRFLALAPHGLRASDLASLLADQFNQLDMAHFISYMNDCFVMRNDGCYDFSHKSIREGLLRRCADPMADHRRLLEHFAALDPEDPVRCREIMYHCIRADDKAYFVSYVQKHIDECGDAISYAAKAAYDAALEDGGQWLCQLLVSEQAGSSGSVLVRFICNWFTGLCVSRMSELTMLRQVLEANLVLAESYDRQQSSTNSGKILGNSLKVLADCCENQRREASLERALELRERQLALFQKLQDENETVGFLRLLAEAEEDMSDTLSIHNAAEYEHIRLHLGNAVEHRKRLAKITKSVRDRKQVARMLLSVANDCCDMFRMDLEKAEACIKEAEQIYLQLYREGETDDYLTCMADVEYSWSQRYRYGQDYERAGTHDKKRIEILQKLAEKDHRIGIRQQLAAAYHNSKDDRDGPGGKYFYHRSAVRLYRGIVQERGTVYDKRNLAHALKKLDDWMRGEEKTLRIPILQEAEAILDELIEAQDLKTDKVELAEVCQRLSWLLKEADPDKAVHYDARFRAQGQVYRGNAYSEVLEILRHMDKKYVDMIPMELIMLLYDKSNLDYDFRMTKPIGEEVFLEDTLAILALINFSYWKKDDLPQ